MSQLTRILEAARSRVKIGGLYQHYKRADRVYGVLEVALNESTQGPVVVYKALYGERLTWTRKLEDWEQKITLADGTTVTRFEEV